MSTQRISPRQPRSAPCCWSSWRVPPTPGRRRWTSATTSRWHTTRQHGPNSILRTYVGYAHAALLVVAVLAVTAGGLPLAASASTARSTAVGGDRAESDDDEAEEYLGLFLTKARAYEAFLARESERADRTGGGVVIVPAEPAPPPRPTRRAGRSGASVWPP